MTRQLRLAHFLVTPVLVWDDGEGLEPGPACEQVPIPVSRLPQFFETFPERFADLKARLEAEPSPPSS